MSRELKLLLISAAVVVLGAAALFTARDLDRGERDIQTPSAIAATNGVWQDVLVADHATDGVLTIVIPAGAADEMDAGNQAAIQLPPVMRLKVGDKIVIRNEDTRPHLVMYAYVLPGATNERVFDMPDLQAYSAGCSVSADSPATSFMTLIVEK